MIYLGSDHAGFMLKSRTRKLLDELGSEYVDLGPEKFDAADDYPDYILPVARKVAENRGSRGLIFGGSGQGEAIAANKIKGIRAALYYGGSLDIVMLSRKHNDSNILSLGARFISEKEAVRAVKVWLETEFEGGRHKRRIEKIRLFEDGN
ncbi:RpiB/LacA/LacB family sugar-phosphate isomerase [Candidatus Omnitrophota bacterium]